jgi:TPP-dependent pyruvate/acetoin dehydrogenase alpha subunit
MDDVETQVRVFIDDAVTFADSSPLPEAAELYRDVYVE